jgi:hypothetical protein
MKKLFSFGVFLLGIYSFKMPSIQEDVKALITVNDSLTNKADSIFESATLQIKVRVDKANAIVAEEKERHKRNRNYNPDPSQLIPMYQSDCIYFNSVLEMAEPLNKMLDEQVKVIKQLDKKINKDMSITEVERQNLLSKLEEAGKKNSASFFKLKDMISDCASHRDDICKKLEDLKKAAEN